MCFFEHLTLSIQYHKMVLPLLSTRKGCLFLASCRNSIQVVHTFPHYCNWSILPTQTCRSSCREMPWSYTGGQWSRWITYMLVGGCISNGRCHWQCCMLQKITALLLLWESINKVTLVWSLLFFWNLKEILKT